MAYATETDFALGSLDLYAQHYPTRLTQPVALYNEAGYFQDEWKPVPNLTVTAAVRVEHNSNPICTDQLLRQLCDGFRRRKHGSDHTV